MSDLDSTLTELDQKKLDQLEADQLVPLFSADKDKDMDGEYSESFARSPLNK